jgi:hypothetical protein
MTRHTVVLIRLLFLFSNSDIASGRPTAPVGGVFCQNIADGCMRSSIRRCGEVAGPLMRCVQRLRSAWKYYQSGVHAMTMENM